MSAMTTSHPLHALDAASVARAFGLTLTEARAFAPELVRAVEHAELVGDEELARRRARADSFAASLAIEDLTLTPEERAFDAFLDQLDLSADARSRLGQRYVAARMRTLTMPIAAE